MRDSGYDESADVFSFGIVLWEIFTRQVPYGDMGAVQVCVFIYTECEVFGILNNCRY